MSLESYDTGINFICVCILKNTETLDDKYTNLLKEVIVSLERICIITELTDTAESSDFNKAETSQ